VKRINGGEGEEEIRFSVCKGDKINTKSLILHSHSHYTLHSLIQIDP